MEKFIAKSSLTAQDYDKIVILLEQAESSKSSIHDGAYDVVLFNGTNDGELKGFKLYKNNELIVKGTAARGNRLIVDYEDDMTFDLVKAIECATGAETQPRNGCNESYYNWNEYLSETDVAFRNKSIVDMPRNINSSDDRKRAIAFMKKAYAET